MTPTPELSIIVNAHREGILAKPSLDSLKQALAVLGPGVPSEVIIVQDRADPETRAVIEAQSAPGWHTCTVEFGDTGRARNHGVGIARGRLVAFLDADDLFGSNWLEACLSASRARAGRIAWHPEVNLYFGGAAHLFRHIDMECEAFDLLDLAFSNLWTALVCTEREILLETPYPHTDLAGNIGLEDWAWNMMTIEKGVVHKVVPGTGHAVRVKPGQQSLLRRSSLMNSIPKPCTLFRQLYDRGPDTA